MGFSKINGYGLGIMFLVLLQVLVMVNIQASQNSSEVPLNNRFQDIMDMSSVHYRNSQAKKNGQRTIVTSQVSVASNFDAAPQTMQVLSSLQCEINRAKQKYDPTILIAQVKGDNNPYAVRKISKFIFPFNYLSRYIEYEIRRENKVQEYSSFASYSALEDMFYDDNLQYKDAQPFKVEFKENIAQHGSYCALHDAVMKEGKIISDTPIGDGYKKFRVVLNQEKLPTDTFIALSDSEQMNFDPASLRSIDLVPGKFRKIVAFVKNQIHMKVVYIQELEMFICDITKKDVNDPLDI